MSRRCTSAKGKELAQETQQVERHDAFGERRSGKQNLQQLLTQPAQELLHHKQTHTKSFSSVVEPKRTEEELCVAVSVVYLVQMECVLVPFPLLLLPLLGQSLLQQQSAVLHSAKQLHRSGFQGMNPRMLHR